jgi:ubiquinone/menaquinone biosynthesis C-methylase UbiE
MSGQSGGSGGRDQTSLFESNEGNAWFRRNRHDLQYSGPSFEVETIHEVLSAFRADIRSILEIGCGDGRKIETMANFFQANGTGIDPSTEAVEAGRERLRDAGNTTVSLFVGTADDLPFTTGQFDLVHFGFSLYVVSRERIYASLAHADRVLRAGGFLSVFDFDPSAMHRRSYAHQPGIFSYKARYDEWLVSTGHYHLVAKRSFSHASNNFSTDESERVAVTILYKEVQPYRDV